LYLVNPSDWMVKKTVRRPVPTKRCSHQTLGLELAQRRLHGTPNSRESRAPPGIVSVHSPRWSWSHKWAATCWAAERICRSDTPIFLSGSRTSCRGENDFRCVCVCVWKLRLKDKFPALLAPFPGGGRRAKNQDNEPRTTHPGPSKPQQPPIKTAHEP
jgi:hypothetical protein